MVSKEQIKAELAGILGGVRPRPNLIVELGRRQGRRARAETISAIWTRARDLGFEGDFARFLLGTFGTENLHQLSDGDLQRAARYLDRCSDLIRAVS